MPTNFPLKREKRDHLGASRSHGGLRGLLFQYAWDPSPDGQIAEDVSDVQTKLSPPCRRTRRRKSRSRGGPVREAQRKKNILEKNFSRLLRDGTGYHQRPRRDTSGPHPQALALSAA